MLFLPLLVAAVAMPLKLTRVYQQFNRRNVPFVRLEHQIPKGAPALVLVRMRYGSEAIDLPQDPAASGAVFWHWSEWPLAHGGGYSPFLDERASLVECIGEERKPTTGAGAWEGFDLRAISGYEYYVVRAAPDSMSRQPALKVLDQFGEWTLFRRIYDVSDEP
jgi:hypothetical protein